jgi:hypothetical protein
MLRPQKSSHSAAFSHQLVFQKFKAEEGEEEEGEAPSQKMWEI